MDGFPPDIVLTPEEEEEFLLRGARDGVVFIRKNPDGTHELVDAVITREPTLGDGGGI